MERKTFTVNQAAKLLGVSTSGVYRAIHDGTFPVAAIKIGKSRWVIPSEPLLALLNPNNDDEGAA
ncbi:helix-turn-helix transcriptional regulator [Corynebacterium pyruviciproducens]|uniref:helix-turn-helix transcriptional regulator n=1 Tax=Corynebacterium pyruviciproducens TaxID=598660 RepID=UPI003B00E84E